VIRLTLTETESFTALMVLFDDQHQADGLKTSIYETENKKPTEGPIKKGKKKRTTFKKN